MPTDAASDYRNVLLVALSGPSSSGKSTCAKALKGVIPHTLTIHQDDFYFPDEKIPFDEANGVQNWDSPEAIDFDQLKKYVSSVKEGKILSSYNESLEIDPELSISLEEGRELKNFVSQHRDFPKTLVVLVDGFMLYHDPELIALFDVKLYFYASYETLKLRRQGREGYNTVGGFWIDPPNYFSQTVWPEYVKHHKYLFENEDIESNLTSFATGEQKIVSFKTDDGSSLFDLVKRSLEAIFTGI